MNRYVNFYYTEMGKEILEKEAVYIHKHLGDSEIILSVGCGPGLIEEKIAEFDSTIKIIGTDISKEMLDVKTEKIARILCDGAHLCFKDAMFDAVVYIASLEFLDDYRRAIKEAYRVLRQKGMILILMLNPQSRYFKDRFMDENSYIRKNIKQVDANEIKNCISQYFFIRNEEYFLGIKEGKIIDSDNSRIASLRVVEGVKREQ